MNSRPVTVSSQKLDVLRDIGVTRVSTGVQSFDDNIRKQANLVGSGKEAMRALELTAKHFRNFNIDLIYGHPHQTLVDWYQTVIEIAALRVPSITLYRLEVKERTTSLKKIYLREAQVFVDERTARHQYFIAKGILEQCSYVESPLGWWILKDTLSAEPARTNHLTTWKKATAYIGLGQGAFTLAATVYYENQNRHALWADDISKGRLPVKSAKLVPIYLTEINQLLRIIRVAKSFVLKDIINGSALRPFESVLKGFLDAQVNNGLFVRDIEAYKLTEAGKSLVH
ncbi:putative radical SAM family enzyme [Candidatus Burkholderia humilis]|nr:putative radical SAM family enzyme [Candidatus Burkholderia humilis]